MRSVPSLPPVRRGGVLFKLLLLLAVLGALAAAAWVVLLPSLVVSTIRSRTGFAVKVDRLSVNPFTATVQLDGLVLENPPGWPESGFVELRHFHADADLFSLFSDRWVADEVTLDLARLTLVRHRDGMLNAQAFKEGLAGRPVPSTPGARGARRGFLIKHLAMQFDQLVYADYSGRKPVVRNYQLALRRDLTNVDSITKIISPLTGAALGLVSELAGRMFPSRPDLLPGPAGQLQDAAGTLQDAGRKTGEIVKGLMQSLEKKKP
ncbi:MAG: hypothetical protein ACHQ5A_13825 [Opitutales bacterium]